MAVFEPLQALLKRLAMVAIGLSSGQGAEVTGILGSIPERAVEDVIEDSEGARWGDGDRLRLLRLLALDARPSVRREVAASMAVRPDGRLAEDAEALLTALASDPSADVRQLAAVDLAALLSDLGPLARCEVVCRWAMDPSGHKRIALATALRWAPETIGARTALRYLAADPLASVRSAALASLATRRG